MERERIGLFGGSFDPVHCGHLLVAQAGCEELKLSRIFFIPAAQSPFKPEQTHAPAQQRLRLLRLALAGHPNYEVDDQEIRRGGTSFTIDTVCDYATRYPGAELFYLIGADHIPLLPKWRAAEELAGLVEFVAIPRPGDSSAVEPRSGPPEAGTTSVTGETMRGQAVRAPIVAPAPFRVRRLVGFPFAVSSSQIRGRVRAGLPIAGLVPDAVTEAIRISGLYL